MKTFGGWYMAFQGVSGKGFNRSSSTGLISTARWEYMWVEEVKGIWTLHFCALGVRVLISKSCFQKEMIYEQDWL